MKKIAYIIGALNQGGLESLMLDVCHMHNDVPFDMICIYRKEGNYSASFHDTGVNLLHVECSNILVYLMKFRKTILQNKVDIVHPQTPYNTLICALALIGTKVKIITTFHGLNFSKVRGLYQWIVYHFSRIIVCVSEYQKSVFEKAWNLPNDNKLCVVYNGINCAKFDNIISANTELPVANPQSSIKLCMVGNFVDGRSQIVIVKAIALLKQQGVTNFDFYFVGRRVENEVKLYDDCVAMCEFQCLDNVHFLGARDDVPALLHQMDGFVYSSAHDTFGIALVEAMIVGLPVLVNDWIVMKEVSHNGEWATLFKTEDAKDCATKIQDLIGHLPERKETAKHIATKVRKEYSIEKYIDSLSKLYDKL